MADTKGLDYIEVLALMLILLRSMNYIRISWGFVIFIAVIAGIKLYLSFIKK